MHAVAAAGGRHVRAIVEHEGGDATVEGSHAMPPSFPFTAGLRVLCERGLLDHRFEAGAGDEVADDAAASALSIHLDGAVGDLVARSRLEPMIEQPALAPARQP